MARLAILFFLLAAAQLSAAEAPVLEEIRDHFKQLNPDIQSIQLQDVKPRHTQYWVLARGIREDEHFQGSLEDELFGLFVIDVQFSNVLRVVDIFPTSRWNDFRVWIDSHSMETIVIKGVGATYEDQPMMREYAVPW